MNLSEFINKTTAIELPTEWMIEIPIYDGTTGKVFVKNAITEYEAKEDAFTYLNNVFDQKRNMQ